MSALAEQFRKESLPWISDLVQPWLEGRPEPLAGTVPPRQLADADSHFARLPFGPVDAGAAADVHFKQRSVPEALAAGRPVLLMIHGFNASTFSWRFALDDLSAAPSAFGTVAYDRPPFGLSERPLSWRGGDEGNPYTPAAGAALGHGLLRSLGVRKAVVVGHSAGAAVAVEMALRHPEAVSALVLVSPAVAVDAKGFLARADLGQLLRFAYTRLLLNTDWPGE